jgi:thiol-disulfide isomerase/thioredoxin
MPSRLARNRGVPSRRLPRVLALLAVPVLAASLAACGSDPNSIAAQAKDGSRKGYISQDGAVEVIAPGDRGKPVGLAGSLLDGKPWALPDAGGDVVVLNVWASWCGPCRTEAPELEKSWQAAQQAGKPVTFMGINIRDNTSSAITSAKQWGITFPSLADPSGVLILNLQGKVSAPPTTLVLDKTGRIAARVNGEVKASTLTGLVDDVLAKG